MLSGVVQAVGHTMLLPGSNIVAIEEVIIYAMHLVPQDEILEAADLLHMLLMAKQWASHFDQWFAVTPIIHPASHHINPIIITNDSQSSMGSSESRYDSMPDLEYPLLPLYILRSPEA